MPVLIRHSRSRHKQKSWQASFSAPGSGAQLRRGSDPSSECDQAEVPPWAPGGTVPSVVEALTGTRGMRPLRG